MESSLGSPFEMEFIESPASYDGNDSLGPDREQVGITLQYRGVVDISHDGNSLSLGSNIHVRICLNDGTVRPSEAQIDPSFLGSAAATAFATVLYRGGSLASNLKDEIGLPSASALSVQEPFGDESRVYLIADTIRDTCASAGLSQTPNMEALPHTLIICPGYGQEGIQSFIDAFSEELPKSLQDLHQEFRDGGRGVVAGFWDFNDGQQPWAAPVTSPISETAGERSSTRVSDITPSPAFAASDVDRSG